jgi:hypothetical protein
MLRYLFERYREQPAEIPGNHPPQPLRVARLPKSSGRPETDLK